MNLETFFLSELPPPPYLSYNINCIKFKTHIIIRKFQLNRQIIKWDKINHLFVDIQKYNLNKVRVIESFINI